MITQSPVYRLPIVEAFDRTRPEDDDDIEDDERDWDEERWDAYEKQFGIGKYAEDPEEERELREEIEQEKREQEKKRKRREAENN